MDDTNPRGKWRENRAESQRQAKKASRGRRLFLFAAALAALVGVLVAVLFYIDLPPEATFVSIGVREYESAEFPPNPWWLQDVARLERRFGDKAAKAYDKQSKDQLDKALKELQRRTESPLVVHLSALARTKDGAVFLLPGDAKADDELRWLPLKRVLDAFDECPAAHKLLLLDVQRAAPDAALGVLADDVAARVDATLAEAPRKFHVLSACSLGQRSHVSEELGASVFTHYLDLGLDGLADAKPARDRRITMRELADYVTTRVDRWVWRNRGLRQTPKLYGPAGDYPLVQLRDAPAADDAKDAKPDEGPAKYPAWLKKGWETRDSLVGGGAFRDGPRFVRRLEESLLRAERRWRSGIEETRLERETSADVAAAQALFDQIAKAKSPRTWRLADLADAKLDEAKATFRPLAKLYLTRVFEPDSKEAETDKARAEEVKKVRDDIVGKLKKLPYEMAAALVVDTGAEIGVFTAGKFLAVHDLLAEIRQGEVSARPYAETAILDRLKELYLRARENGWTWPENAARHALQASLACDRRLAEFAKTPHALAPWSTAAWALAEEKRRAGETGLFAGADFQWREAEESLRQAEKFYAGIEPRTRLLRDLETERDRALAHYAGWAPFWAALERVNPQEDAAWKEGIAAAVQLADLLESPTPEALAVESPALGQWRRRLGEWKRSIDERLARLQRMGDGAQPAEYAELHALLASAHLKAAQRETLWEAARKLGRKLHEGTKELDDADRASGPAPPTAALGEDLTARIETLRAEMRARTATDLLRLAGAEKVDVLEAALRKSPPEPKAPGLLASALGPDLAGRFRALAGKGDLARAERIVRLFPETAADDNRPAFRNPTFALHRERAGALWRTMNERYKTEAAAARAQKSPLATFYDTFAGEYLVVSP